MDYKKLGQRVRDERLQKQLTQDELAERSGISKNFVSLIENGKRMSLDTIVKIANTLNITVDYLLFDGEGEDDPVIAEITILLRNMSSKDKVYILRTIKNYLDVTRNTSS